MSKITLALFILISLILMRPILGNVWYSMHDTTHIARLYLMEETIRGGQFPPIWANHVNNGLGYPLFHFYAPLFYYLSLLVNLVTHSYFVSVKIVLFFSLLFGMIGMYQLMKKWGRVVAFISAIAYATLPYAAVNLYVRGAYAELLSMSMLPWLFYAWMDLTSHKKQILASIVTALFIISHNLIPLITLPFFVVWVVLKERHTLRNIILPTLIALLLSSFYLLPLVFERNFVLADQIAKSTNYSLHYVEPTQLWNSTWGYGGSAVGLSDGMSFKVGKVIIILALLSLIFIRSTTVSYFGISGIISILMTTPYTSWVWDQISILQVVQFPWRYLTLIGFFLSSLAGLSSITIKNKYLRYVFAFIVICSLLYTNLKLFVPERLSKTDLSNYTSAQYLDTMAQTVREFRPRWQKDGISTSYEDRAYYPTWKVMVDGKYVQTSATEDGLLTFENPSYSTNIKYIQSHTGLEEFGYLLTIIGMIMLIYYAKI